ncbi:MAG TPA: cytochrome c peroxidase [Pyrinomonadaceae bacterium]|nr:cytochrome c peroxidase [Pyrinomonadaceae bacterium]
MRPAVQIFKSLILIVAAVAAAAAFQSSSRAPATGFEPPIPIGISKSLWRRKIPRDNTLTQAKVSLGEMLYSDKRLSADGTVSCATCHDPASAFTDNRDLAMGVASKVGTRNAPTVLNAMFVDQLFWDGRAASLEEQAKQPLANPFEMAMTGDASVVSRLAAVPEYRKRFGEVFREQEITIENIAKAIAAYERTLLSANSAFDRFIAGNASALTESQKRGWKLFKGKAKCIECHAFSRASPFFSDFKFHNTGIGPTQLGFDALTGFAKKVANSSTHTAASFAHTEGFTELGRYLVTKKAEDIGAFRTPTLRDVELTAPYMHDGSEKTLIDVVRFYNRGGNTNPNLDKRLVPLKLADVEMNDLVQFMRALTSDDVLRRTQLSTPQNRSPVRF